MNFLPRRPFPPPDAEKTKTLRGWVVVISGLAYTPLIRFLYAAYNAAYNTAYNETPEKPQSDFLADFDVLCGQTKPSILGLPVGFYQSHHRNYIRSF